MTLTKQDFIAMARAIRMAYPKHHSMKLGYWSAISSMCNGLAQSNPKFDRARFIEACRPPGEVVPEAEQMALPMEDAYGEVQGR